MSNKCYVCQSEFVYSRKRKRYERVAISSKLHRNEETFHDVLKGFGCTPQKLDADLLVCLDCAQLFSKHQSLKKQKQQTLSAIHSKSTGYVGQKVGNLLTTPTSTPRKLKKPKLSTPMKKLKPAVKTGETLKKAPAKVCHLTCIENQCQ